MIPITVMKENCWNDTFTSVLDTALASWEKRQETQCVTSYAHFQICHCPQPTDKNGSGLYDACCHNVLPCLLITVTVS